MNKIQTRTELQDNTVLLTNCLMKLPIFSAKNNKELLTEEIQRECFNYKYYIRGYELNLEKDFEVFSTLIRINESGSKTIHINDFLTEMGYDSKRFEWKVQEPVINALDRLNATSVKIETEKFICGFSFINDFYYNKETKEISFSVNKSLSRLYENDKFQKVINLNKFKGLNKTDKAILIYMASNDSKDKKVSFQVSREKLKERISPETDNGSFNRQLNNSLKKLKQKGFIIYYSKLSNDVIGIKYNKEQFMLDEVEMTKKDFIQMQKDYEIDQEIKIMEAEARIKQRKKQEKSYDGLVDYSNEKK